MSDERNEPRPSLIVLDPPPSAMSVEVKARAGHCRHISIEADFESRTLTCQECGATVDEYEWIARVIREWDDIRRHIVRLQRQRDDLDDEVQALKAMRSGLNAAMKRGQKRLDRQDG